MSSNLEGQKSEDGVGEMSAEQIQANFKQMQMFQEFQRFQQFQMQYQQRQQTEHRVVAADNADSSYLVVMVLILVFFAGSQLLSSYESTQKKQFKKVKLELARQLQSGDSVTESDVDSPSDDDQKDLVQLRKATKKAHQGSTEVTSQNKFESDMNHRELVNLIQEQNNMVSSDSLSKKAPFGGVTNQASYISSGSINSAKRLRDVAMLTDHPKAISNSKHPITRICLTGGPCAGKTTALASINQVLTQLGFRVLIVPEAATMLMSSGAMIQTHKMALQDALKFQINVMRTQMVLEDVFLDIALNSEQKCVVICDRGVMDGCAYTDDNVWQALLDETAWNTIGLRDRRYEAVIHMVTAADGAAEFYTDVNNEARYETAEQACALDKKLINAWVGHPHFSIIDNNGYTFEQKIDKTLKTVCNYIGLPTPNTFYKKFLLATKGEFEVMAPKQVKIEIFQIEEVFLVTSDEQDENFLRKTGKNDAFTYSHQMRFYQKGERIEKKRQISAREYIEMCEQQTCPKKKNLNKIRQCFIYDSQYFFVETFLNVDNVPSLLRIETSKEGDKLSIPSFLQVIRDVTNDNNYAGQKMAEKDHKMPQTDKLAIKEYLAERRESKTKPKKTEKSVSFDS